MSVPVYITAIIISLGTSQATAEETNPTTAKNITFVLSSNKHVQKSQDIAETFGKFFSKPNFNVDLGLNEVFGQATKCSKDIAVIRYEYLYSPEYRPSLSCLKTFIHYHAPKDHVLSIYCPNLLITPSLGCTKAFLYVTDGYDYKTFCSSTSAYFTGSSSTLTVVYGAAPSLNSYLNLDFGEDYFRFQCLITTKLKKPCSCGKTEIDEILYERDNNTANTKSERIFGGEVTRVGEFPWVGTLFADGNKRCLVTIITDRWLLTDAYRCTKEPNTDLTARFGGLASGTVQRRIAKIIQHEDFMGQTEQEFPLNNIALLYMERPLRFSQTVRPICLPQPISNVDFNHATLTTVGTDGIGNSHEEKIHVQVISREECEDLINSLADTNFNIEITFEKICSFDLERGLCFNEGGAPLIWRNDINQRSFLVGIAFLPYQCLVNDIPIIYTKVANSIDWIKKITGETFCDPGIV